MTFREISPVDFVDRLDDVVLSSAFVAAYSAAAAELAKDLLREGAPEPGLEQLRVNSDTEADIVVQVGTQVFACPVPRDAWAWAS